MERYEFSMMCKLTKVHDEISNSECILVTLLEKPSFQNFKFKCFEIGGGSGLFSLNMAQRFKTVLFITCEIRLLRLARAKKKLPTCIADNALVIDGDYELIDLLLQSKHIKFNTIYLNFPQPKLSLAKRIKFIHKILYFCIRNLDFGGFLDVKTDHVKTFKCLLQETKKMKHNFAIQFMYFNLSVLHSELISSQTEFEKLFRSKSIPIMFIRLRKR